MGKNELFNCQTKAVHDHNPTDLSDADRDMELIEASKQGLVDRIRALIRAGVDVNKSDVQRYGTRRAGGKTALMHAVENGHHQCVEVLLQAGANVNIVDSNNETALLLAVGEGHDICVDKLIKAGADVNKRTSPLRTVLWDALIGDRAKCLGYLVKAGADVNLQNAFRWTPLMYAANKGLDECLRILVKEGADVNFQTKTDETALVLAASSGHHTCVQILLKAGADVNKTLRPGITALLSAVWEGHDKCLEVFLQEQTGVSDDTLGCLLDTACKRGHEGCVHVLLAAGADVNRTDYSNGRIPIVCATANSKAACLKSLVEAGADVNLAENALFTPLISAVQEKCYNKKGKFILRSEADMIHCVKLLLKSGAYVNMVEAYGLNAAKIHILESRRHPPYRTVLMTLLVAGEIVDVTTVRQIDSPGYVTLRASPVPEYVQQIEPKEISLLSLCRVVVRERLLHLDRHSNLFCRIPRLGLPSSLTSYLLYDMSLDDHEIKGEP